MNIIIRKITESDLKQVVNIAIRNFDEVMSKVHSKEILEKFKAEQTEESYRRQILWKEIFVAEVDGQVVGTGALANFGKPDFPKYSVSNCYVLPELHNHGIGKKILNKIVEETIKKDAKKLHCPSSRNAIQFYEKFGFYIDENQDEIEGESTWMTKNL
jgi:ribosomal protein S18 acetylase RimI-like enzyme